LDAEASAFCVGPPCTIILSNDCPAADAGFCLKYMMARTEKPIRATNTAAIAQAVVMVLDEPEDPKYEVEKKVEESQIDETVVKVFVRYHILSSRSASHKDIFTFIFCGK
jgi:hypothetical protein